MKRTLSSFSLGLGTASVLTLAGCGVLDPLYARKTQVQASAVSATNKTDLPPAVHDQPSTVPSASPGLPTPAPREWTCGGERAVILPYNFVAESVPDRDSIRAIILDQAVGGFSGVVQVWARHFRNARNLCLLAGSSGNRVILGTDLPGYVQVGSNNNPQMDGIGVVTAQGNALLLYSFAARSGAIQGRGNLSNSYLFILNPDVIPGVPATGEVSIDVQGPDRTNGGRGQNQQAFILNKAVRTNVRLGPNTQTEIYTFGKISTVILPTTLPAPPARSFLANLLFYSIDGNRCPSVATNLTAPNYQCQEIGDRGASFMSPEATEFLEDTFGVRYSIPRL